MPSIAVTDNNNLFGALEFSLECVKNGIQPIIGSSLNLLDVQENHNSSQINLLVKKGGRFSFVSNHAANSFAFAVVIYYFYGRKQLWVFPLAGLIAISRVYVGVHYPADIICGALFGYGLAWCMLSVWVIVKMRELKRNRSWVWYHSGENN